MKIFSNLGKFSLRKRDFRKNCNKKINSIEYLTNIKPVKHIVNPIRMKSIDASKLYKDDTLDFVFIDGGHEYEFVKEDIEHWLPKVRDGGILAGDDWGSGHRWGDSVKRAVIEVLKKPIIDRETWIYRK